MAGHKGTHLQSRKVTFGKIVDAPDQQARGATGCSEQSVDPGMTTAREHRNTLLRFQQQGLLGDVAAQVPSGRYVSGQGAWLVLPHDDGLAGKHPGNLGSSAEGHRDG